MSLRLFLYSAQIVCSHILRSLDSLNSEVVALKKHSPTHEMSVGKLYTVHLLQRLVIGLQHQGNSV